MNEKGMKKEVLLTAVIFLQKIITAVADVLWLVALAELISVGCELSGGTGAHIWRLPRESDITLLAAEGLDYEKGARYAVYLILLSAWKRMGYSFGRSLTLKLQNMVRFRLNNRMVEKTSRVPYRLLEDYTFRELTEVLHESINTWLVWDIVQQMGNFVLYSVKTLGVCVLLGQANLLLGILFLILEACHLGLTALGKQKEPADFRTEQSETKRQYLEELALGHKSAGGRSLFSYIGYISKMKDREAYINRRDVFLSRLEREKTEIAGKALFTIVFVLVELGLTTLLAESRIHLGYFIALSVGTYRCLTQGNEEGAAFRRLQEGKNFLERWNRFQGLPEVEDSQPLTDQGTKVPEKSRSMEAKAEEACPLLEEFETLEFKNVYFRYPKTGRYVLHDLNFEMTKGGYYAFVGSNGSGKSTIVKLLSGLYDNYEGEIRVNGRELREIPFEERRRIFAILFQDAARYQDTVAKNIFPQEGTFEEEAERRRAAEEFVQKWSASGWKDKLPQGLDTFLGNIEENGVILSEGEWQQLLISRELAQSAQMRVLDEPMSSLDIFKQSKAYEQFACDDRENTTLLFSHRMAAVRSAKKIFVLQEGTIVEEGSHDQLMNRRGLYAKMYETQAR